MTPNEYTRAVCACLRHATPKEKQAVAQELQDHLADHADALAEAGWACWDTDVDSRDDGRGQSAQRVSLMTGLDGWQGRVNVLRAASAAVAGSLSQALGQMLREGYTFRQPLESEL